MTTNSKEELASRFGRMVIDLRWRRKPVDENWLIFYAAWRGRNTRAFFRSEIFQHYLPAARRAVEKFTKRGAQMVLPTNDFFEVYPAGEVGDDAQAGAVQAFLSYVWTKRIKVYGFVRKLFRHYAMYGRAITKSGVEIVKSQRMARGGKMVDVTQVWPTARVVDPFMFYAYPETQGDIDQCNVLVEDHMMPYDQYKALSENPGLNITPIPSDDVVAPVWPEHQIRRLTQQQLPEPTVISAGRGPGESTTSADRGSQVPDVAKFISMSEVWFHEDGMWKGCWLVWNSSKMGSGQSGFFPPSSTTNPSPNPLCVRVLKPRARHPYRMAVDRELTGEHYTSSMMDDLEPLQVLLNDQTNMTLEGQATQFSPPAVIDPDMVSRPASIVFRPRAKWFMKPEGVKWLEPADTTEAGYRGVSFTMGLIDQYSGSGGMAEGAPQRNMPRAGFAVNTLMTVALSDTKDAAQMIEDQLLSPLCGDLYRNAMEYSPAEQIIMIPGAQGMVAQRMSMQDLEGDFDFKWVGSLQSQDAQARGQRMIAIMGQIGKMAPVVQQQLQMEGKTFDWEYLFRRVWRDALGERGLGNVIRPMTQQEQQMMMQMEQLKAAQAQKPPVKINLSGDLDPFTAKELSGDQSPVPIETLHQAGQKGASGPKAPNAPAGPEAAQQMATRQMGAGLNPT